MVNGRSCFKYEGRIFQERIFSIWPISSAAKDFQGPFAVARSCKFRIELVSKRNKGREVCPFAAQCA